MPPRTAPSTAARILEAATAEFFERGYHGTSMKELAAAVGIRAASLYYHFPSKEDLLSAIMRSTLEDLAIAVPDAIVDEDDPITALRAAVTTHIVFHVSRHREVFLCDAELRALGPGNRAEIVALRDQYEDIFRGVLRRGRDAGALLVPDVDLVTRSLLASCSGVAFWFRPGGTMTVDDVADAYSELFLRALRTEAS